jgi:CRISPR-associated Cas5-like protein
LISEVVQVKVFGDLACFTRPELGTERVSYEVMTPSAARGILEAIFWKPEIKWCVREIQSSALFVAWGSCATRSQIPSGQGNATWPIGAGKMAARGCSATPCF